MIFGSEDIKIIKSEFVAKTTFLMLIIALKLVALIAIVLHCLKS